MGEPHRSIPGGRREHQSSPSAVASAAPRIHDDPARAVDGGLSSASERDAIGRKKSDKQREKKHAKAVKRRKKLASKPPRVQARGAEPASRSVPSGPRPRRSSPPVRHSVWNPEAPGFARPSTVRAVRGPGPDFAVVPFDGRVAVLRRSEDGTMAPIPLHQIPLGEALGWVGESVPIDEATEHEVTWLDEPLLEGGVLRATLRVHTLVDGEEGPRWAPSVCLVVNGDDLDAEVAGGVVSATGVDIHWSGIDTHAAAVARFLESHGEVLWRVLHGGPEIDGATRVARIRGASPHYKRAIVDTLVRHADEVAPHLVAILDEVVRVDPDPADFAPLYALSLVAHLRVRQAHATLLALARLDSDAFEARFGGYLTEQFGAALLRTSGGELSGIQALLCDVDADGFLRSQCAEALGRAVELHQADRAEVLALLASLLTPDAATDPRSYVWNGVGGAMLRLRGVEYQEALVAACESHLIEPLMFGADHVREVLYRRDQPPRLSQERDLFRTDDVHRWLGWWACFRRA
ncbi:MAG: hypothetical protein ACI8PZ_003876 [Myxococcota bacterium]|jgi:hypothetical protein